MPRYLPADTLTILQNAVQCSARGTYVDGRLSSASVHEKGTESVSTFSGQAVLLAPSVTGSRYQCGLTHPQTTSLAQGCCGSKQHRLLSVCFLAPFSLFFLSFFLSFLLSFLLSFFLFPPSPFPLLLSLFFSCLPDCRFLDPDNSHNCPSAKDRKRKEKKKKRVRGRQKLANYKTTLAFVLAFSHACIRGRYPSLP